MASFFHILVVLCVVYVNSISARIVTTQYGTIEGLEHNGVNKFLGIPYAIHKRVYEEPIMPSNFTDTYQAKAFKSACLQDEDLLKKSVKNLYGNLTTLNIPTNFSEDCLFLNVYAPASVNTNSSLPVMFYIHGGGFQIGSGQLFDPTKLVKTGNVIVVTFNYRLGALGFLSILNNTGLWDQKNALKWVQDNINSFGGNPGMVTIFGEGTGGVAVGLHVVSLESKGLLKRAISMGGTGFQMEFIDLNPRNITYMFMEKVGCSAESDMVECFKNVDVAKIMEAQRNLSLHERVFLPVIDGRFLPASPSQLIETGQFARVDYMIGFNNDAGTIYSSRFFEPLNNGITKDEYRGEIHKFVMTGYANSKAIFDTITFEYRPTLPKDNYTENQVWLRQFMTISRDGIASYCHSTEVVHSAYGGKVYAYYFDQVPSFSEHSPLMLMAASGMEMPYVFGLLDNDSLSQQMMLSWSKFATNGDPNLSTENGQWLQFNKTTKHIAQFNRKFNQSSKILDNYPGNLGKRISFWTELLPAIEAATQPCEQRPPTDDDLGSVISLKQGLLRGERIKLTNYVWEQFMDIPFAEPPVGALRWKPPQQHSGWSGIRNSSKVFGQACPQLQPDPFQAPGGESEDCLYLDVFVPFGVKYVRYQKLPVMVFIHGGGYTIGSKVIYNGAALVQYGVIVVTIQYRLGVLGFLSTGDKAASGNFGLMDQNLAIRWTKENIEKFGGDPDKITIFGESAGAGSVMLQMLSPKSKGLFKNVIAESGTVFSPWALDRFNNSPKLAVAVARREGCKTDNHELMIECLRKLSWEKLGRLSAVEQATLPSPKPVVDGDFIPKLPEEIYRENATSEYNLMTGTLKDEGYMFIFYGVTAETAGKDNTNNQQALASALSYTYADLLSIQERNSTEYLMKLNDLLTDSWFSAGTDRQAKLHSKYGGKTYRYFIKFKPGFSFFAQDAPDWVQGCHGDDLAFVFGYPGILPELESSGFHSIPQLATLNGTGVLYKEKDIAMSRNMMTLWTNFASTGDPNAGLPLTYYWSLFTEENPNILLLSENLTQPGHNPIITPLSAPDLLRPSKVAFWNELVPSLDFQTLQPCPGTTDGGSTGGNTDGGSGPTTTDDGNKATDKPVSCNPEIGLLKITEDQANIALWVLGVSCGVLLVILIVTCCKCISIKKKYKKLTAGMDASNTAHDNIAMVRKSQI